MVSAILPPRRKLRLPQTLAGGKILKSCVRCRQHKTKCDASATEPLPCTHCVKRNASCILDVVSASSKREYDIVERLLEDVQSLKQTLDAMVDKKNAMVGLLLKRGMQVRATAPPISQPATPSVLEIQTCLALPPLSPEPLSETAGTSKESSLRPSFCISANSTVAAISISHTQALDLFDAFHRTFHRFLPILPDAYFDVSKIGLRYEDNDLLFWSVVATASLNDPSLSYQHYVQLAAHIESLVAAKCWLNTPRSVFTLAALLVLTTWPLPSNRFQKIEDNRAVKYLSLMKNLSLQLGLHKLEFINEFSHKTNVNLSSERSLNNLVRERIYKFININLNYWLVFLGLSNSNYNSIQNDYTINKASNTDLFNSINFSNEDNYINSLLKVSLIQLKLNENMNDLVEAPSSVNKGIVLNMFETILNDFSSSTSPLFHENAMIKVSVEFTRLQLYIYTFSHSNDRNFSLLEYKRTIYKAVASCQRIVDLFKQEFSDVCFNVLPIHYRFVLESVLLILLSIYKSPFLNSVSDYETTKSLFQLAYGIMNHNHDPEWASMSGKLVKILHKYDNLDNTRLWQLKIDETSSVCLVDRMKNYLVSGLLYELIWTIYRDGKETGSPNSDGKSFTWASFGLNTELESHRSIIDHFSSKGSIFV